MSDEQFLARWSRRKQEARAGYAEPAPEGAETQGPAPSEAAAEPVPQETDLSDDLTGSTVGEAITEARTEKRQP